MLCKTLAAARELNRQLLQPALSATSTPEEKAEAISGAKQVAQYLKSNVLQGIPKSDAEAAYGEFEHLSNLLRSSLSLTQDEMTLCHLFRYM